MFAIARQTVLEFQALFFNLRDTVSRIITDEEFAADMIKQINGLCPFGDISPRLWEIRNNLDNELWGMLLSLGDKFSGSVISFLGSAALFVPEALFNMVVVIIATYYFAIDRVRINCFFLSFFPKNGRMVLKYIKDILSNTVGKYIRAYGLLFFLTFGELLLAFSLLKFRYSFVLALVIAFIDLLPVLGTGTVLIPWAIVLFIIGNYGLGIWILIIYAVITVIRQVLEPKIVGKLFGLHPLAALAAMYIGLKLMGIIGIFLFGIGAIIACRVLELRDEVRTDIKQDEA